MEGLPAILIETTDGFRDGTGVLQDILCENAMNAQPVLRQPHIPRCIPLRPITHIMPASIDLDSQLRLGAVEIEDIGSDRMLSPEPRASCLVAQFTP